MKRLILLLLLPLIVIAGFLAYIYVSAIVEQDKTYYFPQIETYVIIHKPPFSKYGYVFFSRDSVFSSSKNIDYVSIYKSDANSISFVFNPLDINKVYIAEFGNNTRIHQFSFDMEKINMANMEDTTFYKRGVVAGAQAYILQPGFFTIHVSGYLESVYYGTEEGLIKAEPIGNRQLGYYSKELPR